MRLRDRSISPVSGWLYEYTANGHTYQVRNSEGSLDSLVAAVRTHMARNGVVPKDNLKAIVEDQICSRQPAGKCFYESKAGDIVAATAHTFGALGDKVAKVIGLPSPNLEKKARGCSACQKRRERMNQLGNK